MKPSYTTTLSRQPRGFKEQEALRRFLHVIDLCFLAFKLDIWLENFPAEMEKVFDHESCHRITREVSSTTRMVAFISYHGDHASVEITFSNGKTPVKIIRIIYDYGQKKAIFVAEISL